MDKRESFAELFAPKNHKPETKMNFRRLAEIKSRSLAGCSREDFPHDLPIHVSQPIIAALETEG